MSQVSKAAARTGSKRTSPFESHDPAFEAMLGDAPREIWAADVHTTGDPNRAATKRSGRSTKEGA